VAFSPGGSEEYSPGANMSCTSSGLRSSRPRSILRRTLRPRRSGGRSSTRGHSLDRATEQFTGARYQWNDRLFDITNIAPVGTVSFILNDFTRLIGQGGAVDARVAVQIKVTINANGE
jgi:hypothetical protein